MVITDEKIEVTLAMMEEANMTRRGGAYLELGVPVQPTNPNLGVRWTQLNYLTIAHYDAIEAYFLQKQKSINQPH